MRRFLLPLLVSAATVLALLSVAADDLAWTWRGQAVNDFRADHDRHGLEQTADLQDNADRYAAVLADLGFLTHATGVNEIIGTGPDWATILAAWKDSTCRDGSQPCPGHREMLLDRDFTRMGIGRHRDPTGRLWAVMRFR